MNSVIVFVQNKMRPIVSNKETYLQEKLREKMSETGISAHALEKQAGLKRSAVQNILYGKSKKPSAEILRAISKVLDCSITDLLSQQDAGTQNNYLVQSSPSSYSLNTSLYAKAVQAANDIFNDNNVSPEKQDALNYINELYQYSFNNNNPEIDNNFAVWLFNKCWPNNT